MIGREDDAPDHQIGRTVRQQRPGFELMSGSETTITCALADAAVASACSVRRRTARDDAGELGLR